MSSQQKFAGVDFASLLERLAPEPEPEAGLDFHASGDSQKVFFRRFAAKIASDPTLLMNFVRVAAARSLLRGKMTQNASERFIERLRELESNKQMSEAAIARAIRDARTRIVLRYSDEEALEAVRKAADDEPLTRREEGIILHIAPAHPDTYKMQAGMLGLEAQELIKEDRIREAIDLLDAACEIAPISADQILTVGRMLAGVGELKRAIARLEEGFQHFPDSWKIPFNAACYYCRLGDLQMGVRCLARACQLNAEEATKAMKEDPDLAPLRTADLAQLLGQALAAAAGSPATLASPVQPSGSTAAVPKSAGPAASSVTRTPQTARPEWYYSLDGTARMGPVSAEELKEIVASGKLTPEAFVSRDGKTWQPAARLKGIQWPKR